MSYEQAYPKWLLVTFSCSVVAAVIGTFGTVVAFVVSAPILGMVTSGMMTLSSLGVVFTLNAGEKYSRRAQQENGG